MLLVKAAMGIQRVRDQWPVSFGELRVALTFNRKLWTVFMGSSVRDDNTLPAAVRQNVANLGIFILNETREILLEPTAPAKLDVLININRQLAAGLRGS
ncbi:flagellar biosynthesis regulator FlaF [Devosia sp.]|uniref:flagellar biosynthesis regulator FlaF n=1 Tax=Devosia sp. TaxID=1871048 RepID=UPI003265D591